LREERTAELKQHVAAVNALLHDVEYPVEDGEDGEWGGIEDDPVEIEPVDHEEEYIDEDKYTTVTVEAVDVSKEGLQKVANEDEDEVEEKTFVKPFDKDDKGKKVWPKKVRKKKFTYESKAERKFTKNKQKAGNKAKANARRGTD
jgi:ribosomal RNA-processing protein 17